MRQIWAAQVYRKSIKWKLSRTLWNMVAGSSVDQFYRVCKYVTGPIIALFFVGSYRSTFSASCHNSGQFCFVKSWPIPV